VVREKVPFNNFSISHEEVLTTTPLVAEIFEEG